MLSILLAVPWLPWLESKASGTLSEPSPHCSMIYPQLSERVARMQAHFELWVREIIYLEVEEGLVNLDHHIS